MTALASSPAVPAVQRVAGQTAIRPIQPTDAVRLERFLHRLDEPTVHAVCQRRLDGLSPDLLERLTTTAAREAWSFVVISGDAIVGFARARRRRAEPDIADAVVVVERPWRALGLGRRLLAELVEHAAADEVRAFVGRADLGAEPTRRLLAALDLSAEVVGDATSDLICTVLPSAKPDPATLTLL